LSGALGLGFAHSMIAYRSVRKGITKLQVNDAALNADLDKNWEVLGEAIQTLLRKHGSPNAYERLK
jgi:adenylosuccinate lyase